jgi:hypothetical protein
VSTSIIKPQLHVQLLHRIVSPNNFSRRAKVYSSHPAELASGNGVAAVRETTQKAFSEYDADPSKINKPIKTLQTLEGIPLQAATLILSIYDPTRVPYFSDELDRYIQWEEAMKRAGNAEKNISHTMKEYTHLIENTQGICKRVNSDKGEGEAIKAVDVEIVAHQLCKFAARDIYRHEDKETDAALVPEEKPRKKRKTKAEIYEEEHPRGSEKDTFKDIHNCVDKGEFGSPTYDKFGFQLDYDKCVHWDRPMSRASLKPTAAKMKKEEDYFDRKKREEKRMAQLMGDDNFSDDISDFQDATIKVEAYKDKLRNDLGKKTYQVSMDEFETWYKNGFRAKKGEFDTKNMDPSRKKLYVDWRVGSALRM